GLFAPRDGFLSGRDSEQRSIEFLGPEPCLRRRDAQGSRFHSSELLSSLAPIPRRRTCVRLAWARVEGTKLKKPSDHATAPTFNLHRHQHIQPRCKPQRHATVAPQAQLSAF